LEIHILNAAVASINPPINLRGRPPAAAKTERANRRCKFHLSKAMAIKKPPKKRKTKCDPYGAVVSAML